MARRKRIVAVPVVDVPEPLRDHLHPLWSDPRQVAALYAACGLAVPPVVAFETLSWPFDTAPPIIQFDALRAAYCASRGMSSNGLWDVGKANDVGIDCYHPRRSRLRDQWGTGRPEETKAARR